MFKYFLTEMFNISWRIYNRQGKFKPTLTFQCLTGNISWQTVQKPSRRIFPHSSGPWRLSVRENSPFLAVHPSRNIPDGSCHGNSPLTVSAIFPDGSGRHGKTCLGYSTKNTVPLCQCVTLHRFWWWKCMFAVTIPREQLIQVWWNQTK